MAELLASTFDVEAAWGKTLTEADRVVVGYRLTQASAILRRFVPTVDARIAADSLDGTLVQGVVVDMVLRLLRNPDGKVQESIDDYSYRRSDTTATGVLYITDAEITSLSGRRSAAFTITPGS